MAGLPRIEPNPACLGLPEEIFGWEILVRLPAKDVVRCRAVCRAWRRLASTRDFLLENHLHQPSLPLVLLSRRQRGCTWGDLRAFHHRAAAPEAQLQPVVQIDDSTAITVQTSRDGLLLLSVCTFSPYIERGFICNPTTRQIGQVPEIQGPVWMVPGSALPKLGRANYLAKLFAAAVSPRSWLKSERRNQNFGRDLRSWRQSKREPTPAVNAKILAWQWPATIQTDPKTSMSRGYIGILLPVSTGCYCA